MARMQLVLLGRREPKNRELNAKGGLCNALFTRSSRGSGICGSAPRVSPPSAPAGLARHLPLCPVRSHSANTFLRPENAPARPLPLRCLTASLSLPSSELTTSPPPSPAAEMESRSPSPISGSPTATPLLGHNQHHLLPQQPQSKRDKRRNALSEKLASLTNGFHNPANPRIREQYYRAQLSSLQADMQLIAKADVSGQNLRLMDDSPDAVQKEVDAMFSQSALGRDVVADQGMAGKLYSQFLEDINDAMEQRDTDLALLYVWLLPTTSATATAINTTIGSP